ncbi:MAG: hypothetical protein ABSF82_04735 [Candidatus Bathyarchaeia archaeon]
MSKSKLGFQVDYRGSAALSNFFNDEFVSSQWMDRNFKPVPEAQETWSAVEL